MSEQIVLTVEVKEKLLKALASGAQSVCLYSRRDRWGFTACQIGIDMGWLAQPELIEVDEQESYLRFAILAEALS